MLDLGWRNRIRTLWEASKAEELDWSLGGEAEPTVEDAAGWTGTARAFCRLACEAIGEAA